VRSASDVVIESSVLKEQLGVAPEGAELVGAGCNPADQFLFATELRRLVEGEHLEHDGARGDSLDLVLEVILVLVGPAVDIVALELNLERPVRLSLLVTSLIVVSDVHDGGGAKVISHGGELLADSGTSALVVELSEDGHPTVLEEVEGVLSVEGEHSKNVGGVHTITGEL